LVGNFGPSEILIVIVIAFLLFGRNRLPGMGRKASDQLRKTKDAMGEAKDEFELGLREVDDPAAPLKQTMADAGARPTRRGWLARLFRRSR
jgi:sec-independent protein translocase protein TatA